MSSRRLVMVLVGLIFLLVVGVVGVGIALIGGGGASVEEGQKAAPKRAPAADKVTPGGTLRVLGFDPPTLDPGISTDAESATYIVEIFSGLVTYQINDDGTLELVPDLAERWEISNGGRTYTFFLREGAKFHNGKLVKAQDFKWSMERALDPRTLSTVADAYLNDIVGALDRLAGRATEVSGIEVVNDRTLRITIDEPKSYFLAKLTYPTAFVLDRSTVEGNRLWTAKPNGTGPFKLAVWEPGVRIVLERNPDFYLSPPPLERVTYILSGGASMTMYENDEIDVTPVGGFDVDRVLDPKDPLSKQLVRCPGADAGCPQFDVFYIGFDVTVPPFDDVKVRQAFAHAVNREQIAEVVLRGQVLPAKGILPPGFPGYNPNLKSLEFDPKRAQELLAQSRYGKASSLPRIVLTLAGGGATPPGTIEAMLEQWRTNLGVEVLVQQVDFATFLSQLNKHAYPMFSLGWIADYIDPQDFLDILFHSKSGINHPRYSNPEVDRLVEQARAERNEATRMRLYQQAEQIIVNEAPWIPTFHDKSFTLVKPYVKGYRVAPFIVPILRFVSIQR